ncbi:hypothetical protein VXQ17_12205, partial [Acinetobacter towneri]|uniref:hypothetical protein n=1 Tax=Acinetobacter towneri TaxID=202956 RepID=UPI001CE09B58
FIENLLKSRLFDFLLLNSIIFREDYHTDKKIEVINSKNVVIWEAVISPLITVTLSTGCTTGHQQLTLNNNGYLRTGSCTYYNIAASGGGNNASGTL